MPTKTPVDLTFNSTGHITKITVRDDLTTTISEDEVEAGILHSEDIYHAGVKGMKWGVRRRESGGGSSKPAYKQSGDSKAAAKLRNRPVGSMSNKQLKTLNERKRLEMEYSRMNPGKLERGHNVIKGVLAVAGTAGAIYGLAKSPMMQDVIKLGKGVMNR